MFIKKVQVRVKISGYDILRPATVTGSAAKLKTLLESLWASILSYRQVLTERLV